MSRVVIVGGVAGGATAAARMKRVASGTAVTMIERSPDVSFANCGLPYYIGREIQDRSRLALQTPQSLKKALGIDVMVETTVTAVDPAKKTVLYKKNGSDKEVALPYDKLILSPGASPVRPPLPGINDPRIMTLRNLQDMDTMDHLIQKPGTKRVVVIGAGFIGLEMVEQLVHLKKSVTLVELNQAVLPQADPEMAEFLHGPMVEQGVTLCLGDGVKGFVSTPAGVKVQLSSGKTIEADCVVLCIGVRAESSLAKDAGLSVTPRGLVTVNDVMQTSNQDIYAVGDVIETNDMVFPERKAWVCLGNVANMQARIAADHITRGTSIPYKGSLGTAIVRVFDSTLAVTGWSETRLKAANIPYATTTITSDHHAGYYPGATPITLKITFDPLTGRIFGGQALGPNGVDKRIDVIATAIQGGLTIDDLSQTQVTYSPPFGSARDTVNVAALSARNIKEKLVNPVYALPTDTDVKTVIDCRPAENAALHPIAGAVNIPYANIKSAALDPSKEYVTVCALGKTSYFASRDMMQNGLKVESLVGGMRVHQKPEAVAPTSGESATTDSPSGATSAPSKVVVDLDCTGMACPGPLLKLRQAINGLPAGATLKVTASDPGFTNDLRAFAKSQGLTVVSLNTKAGIIHGEIVKGAPTPAGGFIPTAPAQGASRPGATIVVFSQDMDKVLASFVIANGAAAMGGDVTMFFTFWGLNALRKPDGRANKRKGIMDAMFGAMMPKGQYKLPISNMNFGGIGPKLLRFQMGQKNLPTLNGLMASAKEQKIRIVACTMSMDAMGITKEELLDGVELGGVADYLACAEKAGTNLFI